jgi:hypothetical protein
VSLANTAGECRDTGERRPLQTTSHKGLQEFPTGHWTKQLNAFPASFSSEKIILHHGEAKKHWVAGYRMCRSEKVAQALLNYADPEFVFGKAKVEASFSLTKNYMVQLKLNKFTAEVVSAYCTCAAGRGGICKHVGAFLFYLLDVHLAGYSFIPDSVACTEKKQKWGPSAGKANINTTKFKELVFVKYEPGKVQKPHTRKFTSPPAQITTEMLQMVNSTLISSNMSPMLCQVLQDNSCLAVASQVPSTSASSTTVPPTTQSRPRLPTEILWYEEVQGVRKVEYIRLCCDLTLEEAHALEEQTRNQSNSSLWHEERAKRITASKFKDVVGRKKEATEDFINKIFQRCLIQTKLMKVGIENEDVVLQKYTIQKNGTVEIFKCGFVVNPGVPFIGASPDGIVYDKEQKVFGLIEIKTLAKAMEMGLGIRQAIEQKKATFLSRSLTLKKTHRYYMQVQGQLAVTGLKWCDFVVDAGKDMHVERIHFDDEMWGSSILPKLVHFYMDHKMHDEN